MKYNHNPRFVRADYIWLDGTLPTQRMRSKVKMIPTEQEVVLSTFDSWGFDGSSTFQASGADSDLNLRPVYFCLDSVRGAGSYLVLCEVFASENLPHQTNTRAELRRVLEMGGAQQEPWAGFEQEYTFFKDERPLGWPAHGFPSPQGPFYCSIGSEVAFGRSIVEEHLTACLNAGLLIYGTNAEVMPGQWEFQIGYRGSANEDASILKMADELWIARYMLCLIAEKYGVHVSFDVKPVKGDWNGAGMHTNISTKFTRDPKQGMKAIEAAVDLLSKKHPEHIAKYGANNHERLTGQHETCSIVEFRAGVANRGCSIRIPRSVAEKGYGYFEDRRPGANANPYDVALMLVSTLTASSMAGSSMMRTQGSLTASDYFQPSAMNS
jgi:glutamine synthetase